MTTATTDFPRAAGPSWPAGAAGLAAGWVAAGSIGPVGAPLENALVWTLLGMAAVLVRPTGRALVGTLIAAGLVVTIDWLGAGGTVADVADVAAVAVFLAVLARGTVSNVLIGPSPRALTLAAVAVGVLAVWRLAVTSIPTAWSLVEGISAGLGHLVGLVSGRPLAIGPSFGGLDLLVPMVVLWIGWVRWTAPPRTGRAVWALAAIAIALLAYLAVLARAEDLAALLPAPPAPPSLDPSDYRPPEWLWGESVRAMLPWNVSVLGVVFQVAVGAWLLRGPWHDYKWGLGAMSTLAWTCRKPQSTCPRKRGHGTPFLSVVPAWIAIPIGVALVVAVVALARPVGQLEGAKIVVFDGGQLDRSKPTHDNLDIESAGLYGMLPSLVGSFGGEMAFTNRLDESALGGADVLVLLHPVDAWRPEQLEQIDRYVRGGGSLLVVAGPAGFATPVRGAVNDVLAPVGMSIRYDVAVPAIEDRSGSIMAMPHPITSGLGGRTDWFGLRLSSSIEARWPARPILVGTWGYSEPGSDAVAVGPRPPMRGQRLGDLVLLAERPLGQGTVVALADDECLSNLTTVFSYPFVGRLLGYLARRPACPQAWWRQALGLIGCAALVVVLLVGLDVSIVVDVLLAMVVALLAVATVNDSASAVVPEGPPSARVPVAYIDAAHLESYGRRPWSNEGLEGLSMTLMRNGYLPLALYDWSPARLENAAAVLSLGPARAFSSAERAMILDLVNRRGLFVLCVGATESSPHETLLGELGFRVRPMPQPPRNASPEPAPAGQFPDQFGRRPVPYFNAADDGMGDYLAKVWMFHAWPIEVRAADAEVLARDGDVPLMAARPFGEDPEQGWAVVIGDGRFALNMNTGYYEGRTVEGLTENAHFWRWLFSRVGDGKEWIPPDLDAKPSKGKPADVAQPPSAVKDDPPRPETVVSETQPGAAVLQPETQPRAAVLQVHRDQEATP